MSNEWDRRSNEPPKAFRAFTIYRDMGPSRSIDKAYLSFSQQHTAIEKQPSGKRAAGIWQDWSRTYDWVKRAAAYDEWIDKELQKQILEERVNAVIEMNQRHINMAKAMQGKVIQRLQSIQPEDLKPFDVRSWFEIAVKIERLILGAPTETFKSEVVGKDGEPLPATVSPVVIVLPDNGRDPELRDS